MKLYQIQNGALGRLGSLEKFNRVLYGGHAQDAGAGRFFTFAGDVPLFMGASSDYQKDTWCYQAKNGVLQSGLALTPCHVEGNSRDLFSKWFHDVNDITVRWQHGYLDYEMTQFSAYFPDVRVKITVLPLNPDEGYLVHYDITTDQRVIWCAGFGGITPFFGRFEHHHSTRRDFSAEDCVGNQVKCYENHASIEGPQDVTMLIGDDFQAKYSADAPEAMQETYPSLFLSEHAGEKQIVKLTRILNANEHFQGSLVVLRNGTSERLRELLTSGNLFRLRAAIRRKYAAVSFVSPDERLNMSVPDTLISLDASFHGNSFYHGAIGYHAPFLGWRGWYAPALAGWTDRVKSAILAHFNTILHSDLPEKIWYDGADRPDLDHEGTQYHHLINTSGRLTALLYRDDIYDMQEVAIDMTLYYFDVTRDLETANIIYARLLETLDWQERILDSDHDGLYQNFLNTWVSDGHCYNGAGCAQASGYNLRSNLRTAALGRLLGHNVNKLEKRASKIRQALQEKLWMEKEGVLAESLDTIGNQLIHPSPELSTIYLAVECQAVTPTQAARMLLWAKRHLRQVTTQGSHQGKLYYSSEWLPKKYSTFGLFPAENAALALTLFKTGFAAEAMAVLNGLVDAFELSPNPGSLQHVVADSGASDAGDIDFTDVSSCYLRLLFEGLWGIEFARLDDRIILAPQIPDDWADASLTLPDVTMTIRHEPLCDILNISCEKSEEKTILLPLRFGKVDQIFLNGQETEFKIVPGINRGRIRIVTRLNGRIELKVYYCDEALPKLKNDHLTVFAGERAVVEVDNGTCSGIKLPEGFESAASGIFRLPSDAQGEYDLLVQSGSSLLPLLVKTAVLPKPENETVGTLEQIDISSFFNCQLTEVHNRKFLSPRPEGYSIGVRINGRYAWEWNHYGHNVLRVEDTLLRQAKGTFTVPSGVSFQTPEQGDNVLSISVWENFPTSEVIPLSGKAKRIHLFICGSTNAMQSEVVNARCTAVYQDDTETELDLIQPRNFDDFLIPTYQREAESFYISDGTHGLHLVMDLNPGAELKELHLEAVANEVILMLLGAAVER